MSQHSSLLEFVGGPFDGFRQRIFSSVDDLPLAVALPLNEMAEEIFGFHDSREMSDSEALYELIHCPEGIQYRFHHQRPARKALQAM